MPNSNTDDLAVLFADVVESTGLYRQLGDIEALKIISACLDAMQGVLPPHQGRLVKTIGDAVMCLFPDAENAVNAAVDMQRAMAVFMPGGVEMQIRIGLYAGPVVIGGDDVFGDTVNVAAYLADAAAPGQILVAEATLDSMGASWRDNVRPLFDAILKSTLAKTSVYEVLWRDDAAERTHINLDITRMIPRDIGSLLLMLDGVEHRVDFWHPTVTIGRGPDCELRIDNPLVSRRHATIRVERTQFYLVDHSSNGTFITRASGEEIHLMRQEVLLEGIGEIRPGYDSRTDTASFISFSRDRRSIYRV